jgi:3-deoxy-D-manno-octulosonic acid kinase
VNLEPRPLPGYQRIGRAGRYALVHPDFAAHITAALFDGQGMRATDYTGRSAIQSIDTPGGTVLIRSCLRGGFFGKFLDDRYLFANRPRHELEVHCEAWRRGVHTVLPVAATWQQSGPVVRGSIATLQVDADDLLALAERRDRPPEADLAACGRAICSLHAAGIIHGDLQIKNLLARNGEAWVIDFDKARIVSEVGGVHARENLLRLKRSFQKRNLPIAYFDAIRDAYEGAGGASLGSGKFRV